MPSAPILKPEHIDALLKHGVVRHFPADKLLVSEGERGDQLFVVLEGRVRVFVSDDQGREVILNGHGPGEFFGELALIDQAPRSASVICLEPCRLLMVGRQAYERAVAECPSLALDVLKALPQRVRSLTSSLKTMALQDVTGRVTEVLLKLARRDDDALLVEPRPTQQEIASRVGASREMVSRVMKDLEERGFIETREDGSMIVKDRLTTLG